MSAGSAVRAAVMEAAGSDLVLVDDVEVEAPHAGEVRVRVTHCGLCHSDLHLLDGHIPFPTPAILGHEAGGIVVEVGPGVTDPSEGDKVLLTARPPCGTCYWCARGEVSLCSTSQEVMTGMLADGGTRLSHRGRTVWRGVGLAGLAQEVVVRASGAVRVPPETPLEVAAVLGCAVQTGVGAVLNTARVAAGSTVLVVGLGGIGVSIAQGARVAGATRVIGVDPNPERRRLAVDRFGVTDAIDPQTNNMAVAALALTGGIGVDYAFEAVGGAPLVEACIQATRPGGTTVMVGVGGLEEQVSFPALLFGVTERKLLGCFLGSSNPAREFPRLLELWRAGRLDLDGMVTGRRPLDEVNEGFADLRAGRGLRTVIEL